jgi:hypothetical protein
MKIKETIERECCERKDLKPTIAYNKKWQFCVHCGQLWRWDREFDGAGGSDVLVKVRVNGGADE